MCRKLILLAALVCVLGLIGAAEAAFDTVGVYDPDDAPHHNQVDQSGAYDSHTGNAGPENVIDLATFQELIGPAFEADAGGVVSGESPDDSLGSDDVVIANFGVSGTKSVNLASGNGNLSFGAGSNGDGSSSGNRLPLSGIRRFARSSGNDFSFTVSEIIGGEPDEVITYFAGSLVERDNRDPTPMVVATFSDGSTVTATADMAGDGNSPNSKDTFFGFRAPEGTSIVFVDFQLSELILLDDVAFITSAFIANPEQASSPSPVSGATDVPPDVVLSWRPAEGATGHDVYLGADYNDVSDASRNAPLGLLVGPNHDANDFTPATVLDLGQTYYWRVDEIVGASIFKGELWEFTIEPVSYAIDDVNATASSSSPDQGPENTVSGSGLSNDLHSREAETMWLSDLGGPQPTWIQFEFDNVYVLHEMWVWNSNTQFEMGIGYGARDVSIEYSVDGIDYVTLGTTHEFSQAPAEPDYAHNTTVDFGGLLAKYVRVTVNSSWGGFLPQFGLSEVRFFHIPLRAREPNPDSGATNVDADVILSWRAGREAAEHDVYLSADEQAVIDGNAPVTTVTEPSYGPSALDLGQTYYWRVDEVNMAETLVTLDGDVWNFTIPEYLVVDDFESYNDIPAGEPGSNFVYETWLDGYGTTTNGSAMGYTETFQPSMETSIVHDGEQSVPLFYDNTTAAYSEVTANVADLQGGQDWTGHGIKALTLRFFGDPNNNVQQMYVKLNGSKLTYDGDVENLSQTGWQMWYIDLASIGVSLSNVTELAIGFERIGAFGGQGVVYLDGVRLYSYDRQLITPVDPGTAGLQAHYEFEGTTNDSSGNNYHGVPSAAATYAAGKSGQAITLDGNGQTLTNELVLPLAQGSIAHWLKPNQLRRMAAYYEGNSLDNGWGNGDNTPSLLELHSGMHNDAGQWSFYYQDGPGTDGAARAVANGGIGQIGVWTHVAATWNTSGDLILYLNGVEVDREDLSEENFVSNTAIYHLIGGVSELDTNRDFDGAIDDVRIYDRALSGGEIAGLAGRTLPFDRGF